jgi:chemotaxis protein MotA
MIAVSGFAKGHSPLIAVEIARRTLESTVQPDGDELENILKTLQSGK